eukprot:scaffold28589_cov94-Skeletonema_dohrnii-CCMP3373.AAC.1
MANAFVLFRLLYISDDPSKSKRVLVESYYLHAFLFSRFKAVASSPDAVARPIVSHLALATTSVHGAFHVL